MCPSSCSHGNTASHSSDIQADTQVCDSLTYAVGNDGRHRVSLVIAYLEDDPAVRDHLHQLWGNTPIKG